MKKTFILIFIFVISLFVITGCAKSNKIESDIISFTYEYGSYNNGYYKYTIFVSVEENMVMFTAEGHNGVNLNINKEIDSSYLNQLSDIINDNKIYEWDGFHKSEDDVMDGYSFKLNIGYKNGETIDASGYMKYPDNYDNCHEALLKFLKSIK